MDALVEANGEFAFNLLKLLCQDCPSQNVFFSPLSICSTLAMTLLGSKGNTASQVVEGLSLKSEKDIHQGFQALLSQVNKPNAKYLLRIANRLFGEKTCEFSSTFKESCLQFYQAELEQLPFAEDAEMSTKHINTWVSQMTAGKISDLLSEASIDSQTKLVLVNAIYFKGKWKSSFNKMETFEEDFEINEKNKKSVQMMRRQLESNLGYIEEVQAQLLELPYEGKKLSMFVLLPNRGVDLSSVEAKLTFEKFQFWTSFHVMRYTDVTVFLPRFKMEADYKLEEVLQHLGIKDMFQPGQADFAAMSAQHHLSLSQFVHKSMVEVNEEGTEAAAASAFVCNMCYSESISRFYADRPFLFFIRHNETNCILFCGRFSSP